MTTPTRRSLLRAGAAAAALAPFGWATPADAAVPAQRLYRRRRFIPLRGRTFVLKDVGRRWNVRLTQVRNLPRTSSGDDVRFQLTFTSRVAGPPQGTYLLTRKGFLDTYLFLVPSGPDRRTHYAVINRPS